MQPFNEVRDNLDAYLHGFEMVAKGQEWPTDKCANALSLYLTGDALTVIGRRLGEVFMRETDIAAKIPLYSRRVQGEVSRYQTRGWRNKETVCSQNDWIF